MFNIAFIITPGRPLIQYDSTTGEVRYENGVVIGDVFADVDGYEKFWPRLDGGYWKPHVLRAIADLVDFLNEGWDKQVREGLEAYDHRT